MFKKKDKVHLVSHESEFFYSGSDSETFLSHGSSSKTDPGRG